PRWGTGRLRFAVAGWVGCWALSAPKREGARPRRNIARRGGGPARRGCRRWLGHERCPPKGYAGVIGKLRAGYKTTARKRHECDDDCAETVEVADELEHLTRTASQRRANRTTGVLPRKAHGRADNEPRSGQQAEPAAERARAARHRAQQQQPGEHCHGAWQDVQPETISGVVPRRVRAERVVEIGTDERDQRSPDP